MGDNNFMRYIVTNELYHFGVKGMKWGVRKDRQNGGDKKWSLRKARQNRDYKKLAEATKAYNKDYGTLMRAKKTVGELLDENGNTIQEIFSFGPNGAELVRKAEESRAKVDKLALKMSKRYKNISVSMNDAETGKAYADIILGEISGRVEED